MKQPIATLTNLPYVIFGILAIPQNPLMGTTLIALGVASGLYHATLTKWAQAADEVGMYAVLCTLMAYSSEPFGGPVWPYVAAYGLFTYLAWNWYTVSSREWVPALFGMSIILTILQHGLEPAGIILALFGAGLIAREVADNLDGPESSSFRHEILHGVVWHTITAIGFFYWTGVLARNLLIP